MQASHSGPRGSTGSERGRGIRKNKGAKERKGEGGGRGGEEEELNVSGLLQIADEGEDVGVGGKRWMKQEGAGADRFGTAKG